jgi:hypothetical protein
MRFARHFVKFASPSISFGSRRNNRRHDGTHSTLMSADKPVATTPYSWTTRACAGSILTSLASFKQACEAAATASTRDA